MVILTLWTLWWRVVDYMDAIYILYNIYHNIWTLYIDYTDTTMIRRTPKGTFACSPSTISWHFSLLMKTMINRNFNSGILLQQPRPGAVQLLPCDSSQSSSIIWTLLLDSSFLSYFFQLNRVLPNCMTKLNVQYFNATRIKHEKKLNFN